MAKMNITGILTGIESALKAVNELMPIAQKLGAPAIIANVSTIAIAAIGVAHNVLDRAETMKEALATEDEAKLRGYIGELQKINDTLAGQIGADEEAPSEPEGGDSGGGGA